MDGIEWNAIFDLLWAGMTVPQASESLGYEWKVVRVAMDSNLKIKGFCLDVCMVASYRDEEILSGDCI